VGFEPTIYAFERAKTVECLRPRGLCDRLDSTYGGVKLTGGNTKVTASDYEDKERFKYISRKSSTWGCGYTDSLTALLVFPISSQAESDLDTETVLAW
jgi:hypothetical protein